MVISLETKSTKYPQFDMVVRRSHVLKDVLRRMDRLSFNPERELNVSMLMQGAHLGREVFTQYLFLIGDAHAFSSNFCW